MGSDYIWVEEKAGVITWVSNDGENAARHNINPGCCARKYIRKEIYDREIEDLVHTLQLELAAKEEVIKVLHDDIRWYRIVLLHKHIKNLSIKKEE